MIHRCRWPLVYGAIILSAQTAAAETPPEPRFVSGSPVCSETRLVADTETLRLFLARPTDPPAPNAPIVAAYGDDGRWWLPIEGGEQVEAVNAWLKECRK